jgi:hypothetical protein
MIGRAKYATALVDGALTRQREPFDAGALVGRAGRSGALSDLLSFYAEVLRGSPPSSAERGALLAALGPAAPDTGRRAVALIIASPAMQLA